jgi:hypothetical protein
LKRTTNQVFQVEMTSAILPEPISDLGPVARDYRIHLEKLDCDFFAAPE